MGKYRAGPHGCDVARKAMWLCHVDARDGLCGARMTRVQVILLYSIFYNGYSSYKHSIEEFKLTLYYLLSYIPDISSEFIPCGTMFRGISLVQETWTRDERWISLQGCRSRGPASTRSRSQHVFNFKLK